MKNVKVSHSFPKSDKLHGIYRGVVENRFDPEKRGRVQVRVFGLHSISRAKGTTDGIPIEELPWFEPALSLFGGSISGFGAWTVPLQGSHVYVFFENGNITQPRYFASSPGNEVDIPSKSEGFSDPEGIYPTKVREDRQDQHPLNTDEVDESEQKTSTVLKYRKEHLDEDVGIACCDGGCEETWDEPQPYYYETEEKYPYNNVITLGGVLVEFDTTPQGQRLHIYHPSNTYIEISKEGNMIIRNDKDRYEIVKNNRYTHVLQNDIITIDGDKKEKIDSNKVENIKSDYCRNTEGDEEIKVTGGRTVDVKKDIILKGANIYLN